MAQQQTFHLPKLIIGTAAWGQLWPGDLPLNHPTFRLLDELFERGCTAFDTAAVYQLGGTERLLGQWLFSRKLRNKIQIVSKGGHPHLLFNTGRLGARALQGDLEASLRRLRTDCLELYLLHRDDVSQPVDAILPVLAAFQQQGKVKAYGVSNWTLPRLQAATDFLAKHGLPPLAASSPHFSLLEWTKPPWAGCVSLSGASAQPMRAFHQATQLPVIAWSPLGNGFFSDDVQADAPLPRALRSKVTPYVSAENFERKKRAASLAQREGVSVGDIALAYVLNQPFPVHAVVSTSKAQRMKQNWQASQLRLSPADRAYLETGKKES